MRYRVSENECLVSIANKFGYTWERLWNLPENAKLKRTRGNPNVLFVGDEIELPDLEQAQIDCASNQRHRFKKLNQKALFRLRLLEDGVPRKNQAYKLEVEGEVFSGRTDGDGRLEHMIASKAESGVLLMDDDSYLLAIGRLDPQTEISGIQQRLRNLGYFEGIVDGTLSEETRGGLKSFQEAMQMEPTGELTDETRSKLVEKHGS